MSTEQHHKFNIILDLDNTIISAEPLEELSKTTHADLTRIYKDKFPNEIMEYNMDGYYTVFCRPHLQEFFDYLFTNFNVSVWTAAAKDYALFIIQNIILKNPSRKLDYIFFSYHCDWSKKEKNYTKQLCMLWDKYKLAGYSEKNTIIIDDYKADVHKCQPNNCIVAPPFEVLKSGSENDTFLKDIIPHLEELKKKLESGQVNDKNITIPINIYMKTV